MNLEEIEKLKEKVKAEYQEGLQRLDREYKEKMQAIEVVSRLFKNDDEHIGKDSEQTKRKTYSTAVLHASEKENESEIETEKLIVSDEVRKIIDGLSGNFSLIDIRQRMSALHPGVNLSRNVTHNVLSEYKEKDKIKLVKKSSGRSPAVYIKTDEVEDQKEEGYINPLS